MLFYKYSLDSFLTTSMKSDTTNTTTKKSLKIFQTMINLKKSFPVQIRAYALFDS